MALWNDRYHCPLTGMYQFYEPEYSPLAKEGTGSGYQKGGRFTTASTGRSVLYGIHSGRFSGVNLLIVACSADVATI